MRAAEGAPRLPLHLRGDPASGRSRV